MQDTHAAAGQVLRNSNVFQQLPETDVLSGCLLLQRNNYRKWGRDITTRYSWSVFAVEKATRSRAPRSGGTSRGARPNSRQATMNSCNFPAGPLRGCLKKLVRKMVSITTARSSVGTIFGELMLSIKETCIALEESQEETN
mmetsp:Transcript_72928/g.159405  ORF Transcript_72928/g.159405 Transcript_72928/m.159405 type:complete len:141 (-) Transcript_72928:594-1016(-)